MKIKIRGFIVLERDRRFMCAGDPSHVITPTFFLRRLRSSRIFQLRCPKCGSVGNYRIDLPNPCTIIIKTEDMRADDAARASDRFK